MWNSLLYDANRNMTPRTVVIFVILSTVWRLAVSAAPAAPRLLSPELLFAWLHASHAVVGEVVAHETRQRTCRVERGPLQLDLGNVTNVTRLSVRVTKVVAEQMYVSDRESNAARVSPLPHNSVPITSFLPLAHVTSIGNCFLNDCIALTAVDLTPYAHLTSVSHRFLQNCEGLTAVDLVPLALVTHVNYAFLRRNCGGLAAFDLTPFTRVRNVVGLTSLDLGPLFRITTIGSSFLQGCVGLTTLDRGPSHAPCSRPRLRFNEIVTMIQHAAPVTPWHDVEA